MPTFTSQCDPAPGGGLTRAFLTACLILPIWLGIAPAQSWQPLHSQPQPTFGTALLLTDGTVMVQDQGTNNDGSRNWWKLTPDQTGSYINGTWTQLASMQSGYMPQAFASAVLADGRVVVIGGEYNGSGTATDTNLGAIYNPVTNTWATLAAPSTWTQVGDAPTAVLPNGQLLLGHIFDTQLATLDPATLTWTLVTSNGKADRNAEEAFTLLPDGTILVVNTGSIPGTQRYLPSTGQWISAGNTPSPIADSVTGEVGPAVLRPDGTVLAVGATGHNAVYTPPNTLMGTGTWVAAQDFPIITGQGQLDVEDGPAVLLPSGNVLVAASPGVYMKPVHFFEFNGTNLTEVVATPNSVNDSSYYGRLMMLPTGQALYFDTISTGQVYTPLGSPNPAWAPTITSGPAQISPGSTYSLSGTQFNGLSQAVAYGDDYQGATNYPLVRVTNMATGHVFYCRTHDHSTMAVATGAAVVSTQFDVPLSIEPGASTLVVVANGIPSAPWTVSVNSNDTMMVNAGTTPQSATVHAAFANALAVTVKDAGSNPVTGVNVTFTAPGSGASGLFSNSTTTIVVATNSSGIASASFTANATAGGPYNVTASATGLTSVNFSLTNTGGTLSGPTLVSPANGVIDVSLTASLIWEAAAGATSYDVYFGTSSTPPFVVNQTATTYSPGTLATTTTYYWQIVARNGSGTAPSATWSFTSQGPPLQFYPVAPCRLVDTRGTAAGFNGISPFSGPSVPGYGTITIPVQSAAEASANTMPAPCGVIPSTAQAYSFNLTVVPAAGGAVDYVSLWPAGSSQPFVSTLDDPQGLIVSNAAIVPAGSPSGGISVYNAGPSATDVILDMNGYFAPAGAGLEFYPVAPCRLVDTRGAAAGFNGISPFSGPPIPPAGTATIPVQSATEASTDTEPAPCGVIPSGAQAYSFNLTVVPTVAASRVNYVSMWPAASTQPFVSTLDDPQGQIVSNAAIVPAGRPSGGVSVFNDGPATTDVVIDMNGYFAAPTALRFYPVAPCRLVDTRGAAAGFNGIAPFSGPSILGGGTITIPVQSATEASTDTEPAPCGVIPSVARAYSINLTVVPAGTGRVDYVSLWPAGSTQPVVSTLDDPQGLIVANAAIVPAGSPSGGISVYNAGPSTTDVVIDMNGYFAP